MDIIPLNDASAPTVISPTASLAPTLIPVSTPESVVIGTSTSTGSAGTITSQSISNIKVVTQAQYNSLVSKPSTTLYVILP